MCIRDRYKDKDYKYKKKKGFLGDIFDFVPLITIDPENGKVIFTKAKPFGAYLQNVLGSNDPKFVFNDLYDQQKQVASQSNLALRYTCLLYTSRCV